MGVTVRQKTRGKGKPWWVFISHNGKRTSRMVGDKSAAEAVASKIRAKLQLGDFGFEQERKRDATFREYADSWITTTIPATCKESTLHSYDDILRIHVLPVFGHLKVRDITRGRIKDFLAHKVNEGFANSTVIHMKNALSGILNKAVDDEVVTTNPVLRLGKIAKGKSRSEDIAPLTRDECKALLDKVKTHFARDYPLFVLLARTGMRIGEALGLQWGDIDFNGRFITVERGLARMKIETPKSGKSRRVDMSPQLTDALRVLKLECKKKGLALGLGDAPEYVFNNEKGGFIDVNNWRRRVFNKALEKAGLRKIRIHDLRHTYATLRLSKGDNITDVSNQLGHHSVKLTLDIYNHWLPGKKKSEVDALDDERVDAPYPHPKEIEEPAIIANSSKSLAGATGVEPATSGLTGRRSNQTELRPRATVW